MAQTYHYIFYFYLYIQSDKWRQTRSCSLVCWKRSWCMFVFLVVYHIPQKGKKSSFLLPTHLPFPSHMSNITEVVYSWFVFIMEYWFFWRLPALPPYANISSFWLFIARSIIFSSVWKLWLMLGHTVFNYYLMLPSDLIQEITSNCLIFLLFFLPFSFCLFLPVNFIFLSSGLENILNFQLKNIKLYTDFKVLVLFFLEL